MNLFSLPDPDSRAWRISNRLLAWLFALLALALAAGGAWFYREQAQVIRQHQVDELSSIARLKIDQISRWTQERLTDARMTSASPFVVQAVSRLLEDPANPALQSQLRSRLQLTVDLEGYRGFYLTDPEGQVLLSFDPAQSALEPEARQLAARAAHLSAPILGDFYRSPLTGRIVLDLAAPVLDQRGVPEAVLILRINPEEFLYPLIQSWPIPSQSAETLLVRREGNEVLYLNTLRFAPDAALNLRLPLSQGEVPAVQAALGKVGEAEGRDYRGVKVLAVIRPVPGMPWSMVAKMDQAEVFERIRSLGLAVGAFVALGVFLIALLAGLIFSNRQRLLYERLLRLERERREAQEEIRTTLYSIGDAVITTDREGRVTRMNPVAEALTGWREEEARGKPLPEVFHIVQEMTRTEAENPVERVLREGVVVGLANHTLLIARDGAERPIADSGAPIRGPRGEIGGVVLVFRDQTKERAAQRERALLHYAISESRNEIYLFDAESLQFRFANEGALKNLGYPLEELLRMTSVAIKPEFTEQSFRQFIQPLLEGERETLRFETVHRRADGSEYPVAVQLQLLQYEGERIFLAVIEDITERKRAEQALRENEARLEQAQALAHVGNWEMDLGQKVIWASAEAFRIYGLERATPFIPLELARQIPLEEERPRLDAALDDLFAGRRAYDIQFRIRRASDGALRVVHSVARLEYDEKGAPVKVAGVIQDITERRQAEQALLESEERYRALFQNNHAVMMLIDPETGAIVDANPAAAAFYGWAVDELTRMKISQISVLSEEAIRQEMALAKSQRQNHFVFQHRKKDGQLCDVEVFSGPIRFGGRTYLYSIVHDITERKRMEARVAEQLDELRRWHSATLGRESRILELKAEVNELCVAAGMPPRYPEAKGEKSE
jgi:PAS domain S-box-containing protein